MKDFFADIDKTITVKRAQEDDSKAHLSKEYDGFTEIAERLGVVVNEYATELRKRNVKAVPSVGHAAVSLELKYRSGDSTTLMLVINPQTGRFSFETHYPSEGRGARYKSLDGSSFDTSTWEDAEFIKRLEAFIQNFFFYADRHQGF